MVVTQIGDHIAGSSSPSSLPTTVLALEGIFFYRENTSALSFSRYSWHEEYTCTYDKFEVCIEFVRSLGNY